MSQGCDSIQTDPREPYLPGFPFSEVDVVFPWDEFSDNAEMIALKLMHDHPAYPKTSPELNRFWHNEESK